MKKIGDIYFSEYEVTKELWDSVRFDASEIGYTDLNRGRGKGNEPVTLVNWFDSVKFCNALSEVKGYSPYYKNKNGDTYRSGFLSYDEIVVDKNANGFRLPTSDEWHNACSEEIFSENKSEFGWFYSESMLPCEVGKKKSDKNGLYDMAGNVCEWCFGKTEEIFAPICGSSVALDTISEKDFTFFTSPYFKSFETGFRICSDFSVDYSYKNEIQMGEETILYDNFTIESVAKELYENLDNSSLSFRFKELYKNGTYQTALEFYRDEKLKEFASLPYDFVPERYLHKSEDLCDLDFFDIKWFGKDFDIHSSSNLEQLLNFSCDYEKTNDDRFLKGYFTFLKSYLIRHKAEFENLTNEELIQKNNVPNLWAWGHGFDPGKRSYYMITSLKQIAKCLKGNFSKFPADLFGKTAVSMMTYGMYPMMKDGRLHISNQVIHVAAWVLETADCFSEFCNSKVYHKIATDRWYNGIKAVLHPDGTATEQSVWYNRAFVEEFEHISKKLNDKNSIKKVEREIVNISRMLNLIRTPYGMHPNSSVTTFKKSPNNFEAPLYRNYLEAETKVNLCDSWKEALLIQKRRFDTKGENLLFNSVFFPYGGISVIRESWDVRSRYLYFFSPREGSGHTSEGINDIQLSGFGRDFLISGGMNSYGYDLCYNAEQRKYSKKFDEYSYSTLSKNSGLVDFCGQSRNKTTEQHRHRAYENTIGYRWHEDENFVFTEGIYDGEYYGDNRAIHHRMIVFCKLNGLFFITDDFKSENSHNYTVNWSFMPKGVKAYRDNLAKKKELLWESDGFLNDDVKIDEFNGMIYTIQKHKPNIFLRSYSTEKLYFEKHNSQTNPVIGWYADYDDNGMFAYPKNDVYVSSEKKKSVRILTIIETTENEISKIENLKSTDNDVSFIVSGKKCSVKFDNITDIRIGDFGIYADEKNAYVYSKNEKSSDIKAPTDFKWKEKDGLCYPSYEY